MFFVAQPDIMTSYAIASTSRSPHHSARTPSSRSVWPVEAVLVSDVEEVLSLLEPLGAVAESAPAEQRQIFDGLSQQDRMLADALPVRSGASIDALVSATGLPMRLLLGALRRLERDGLALERDGLWRRPRIR